MSEKHEDTKFFWTSLQFSLRLLSNLWSCLYVILSLRKCIWVLPFQKFSSFFFFFLLFFPKKDFGEQMSNGCPWIWPWYVLAKPCRPSPIVIIQHCKEGNNFLESTLQWNQSNYSKKLTIQPKWHPHPRLWSCCIFRKVNREEESWGGKKFQFFTTFRRVLF